MAISDFALLAALLVGWMFWEFGKSIIHLFRACQSRKWVPAKGIISRCLARPGNRKFIHFHTCVDVCYRYHVNAIGHDGNVRGYHCDSRFADDFVAGHPPGTQVEVFYDPKDPRRAVLEPGVRATNIWAVGGLGALVACIILAVWLQENG